MCVPMAFIKLPKMENEYKKESNESKRMQFCEKKTESPMAMIFMTNHTTTHTKFEIKIFHQSNWKAIHFQ